MHYTCVLTVSEQDQGGTSSFLILLVNCQYTRITYMYWCVYSEKLVMMTRGTVRNM